MRRPRLPQVLVALPLLVTAAVTPAFAGLAGGTNGGPQRRPVATTS